MSRVHPALFLAVGASAGAVFIAQLTPALNALTAPWQGLIAAICLIGLGLGVYGLAQKVGPPPPGALLIKPVMAPAVRIRVDGSENLRLLFRAGEPQVVLVEFGIINPNPELLVGAGVNLLITEGLRLYKCDRDGNEETDGGWYTTDGPEALGDEPPPGTYKEFWGDHRNLMGGGTLVPIQIKLLFSEPGTYYASARVWGAGLDGRVDEPVKIVVEGAEEIDPRGRLGEVIAIGEETAKGPASGFEDNEANHQAWIIRTAEAQAYLPPAIQDWLAPRLDAIGAPGHGTEYRIAYAKLALPYLYEARRRLAHAEGT